MSSVSSPRHVEFARGLYPLGLALALFPLADILSRLVPPNFSNLQWRFAALGLTLSSLSMLLVGLAIIGVTAALRGNTIVLRILSVTAWLGVLAIAAVLLLFLLDALQARGLLQDPRMRPSFYKTVLTTVVAGILSGFALVGIAIAALRAARGPGASKSKIGATREAVLVFSGGERATGA